MFEAGLWDWRLASAGRPHDADGRAEHGDAGEEQEGFAIRGDGHGGNIAAGLPARGTEWVRTGANRDVAGRVR